MLYRVAAGAMLTTVALLVVVAAIAVVAFLRPHAADAAPRTISDDVSSSTVYFRACGGTAVQQPMTIAGWCASGDDLYSNLQWTSWGAESAVAVGTWFRNSCDCASGRIERYPVRLTMSAPKHDRGALRWTHVQTTYPAQHPAGTPGTERFHLTPSGFVRLTAP